MDAELVSEGDEVVCIASVFDGGSDAVIRVTVDETVHTGIYDLFVNSRAEPSVIRDVFEVAIELGQKGQKGKPVGALFVVGDAGKVMNKSRPLSYNPFEKSHVHVGDPIVNVMLKEFSRLDGAFVVSDSGKIVSAYRYLEPGAEGVDIPKGLGARHMAGGAITRDTNATAIVLSESDGLVRAFKAGELVLEIDPEELIPMSAVPTPLSEFVASSVPDRIWLALFVLLFGLFAAYVVGAINRRLLTRAGVPEVIEGTAFERTAHEFDTSTVRILAKLSSYFILAVAVIVALTVADVNYLEQFWSGVAAFLPRLFVAIVVLIVGVVVGDKAELLVAERLRGIKDQTARTRRVAAARQIQRRVRRRPDRARAGRRADARAGRVVGCVRARSRAVRRAGNEGPRRERGRRRVPPPPTAVRDRRRGASRRRAQDRPGGRPVRHPYRGRRRGARGAEPLGVPRRIVLIRE